MNKNNPVGMFYYSPCTERKMKPKGGITQLKDQLIQ